jgi:hypothetical protein
VEELYAIADSILAGGPCGQVRAEYGPIYWDVEEALFVDAVAHKEGFYREFEKLVSDFLAARKIDFDPKELDEVFAYQKALIPEFFAPSRREFDFSWNVPEYFETFFSDKPALFVRKPQRLILGDLKDYRGDKKAFATEIVVWGRKSNRMLNPSTWKGISEKPEE